MTSFNRVLLSAARGRIERYLKFPVSWVFGEDIARGCILALDKGVSGERYMLDGRPEDVVSIANACNRMGQLAGLDHEVVDIEPSDDPELAKVFGPTLVAIAEKAAQAAAGPAEARGLQDVQAAGLQPHQPRRGIGHDARVVPRDRQARQPVDRWHARDARAGFRTLHRATTPMERRGHRRPSSRARSDGPCTSTTGPPSPRRRCRWRRARGSDPGRTHPSNSPDQIGHPLCTTHLLRSGSSAGRESGFPDRLLDPNGPALLTIRCATVALRRSRCASPTVRRLRPPSPLMPNRR